MKKISNKGFTLIELIIAISILTIVIFIGYKTINGISISTNSQKEVTLNQSSANLVNQYLTKDIEQSKSVSNKETLDDKSYKYTIVKDDTEVDYIVENYTKKSIDVYNLTRQEDSSTIVIVEGQQRYNDTPFLINTTQNNGIYEVLVDYKENKNNKQYSFNVSSRLMLVASDSDNNVGNGNAGSDNGPNEVDNDNNTPSGPTIEDIPDLPEEVSINTTYIGFWKSDHQDITNKNIGVWIDKNYKDGTSYNSISNISATLRPGNSGSTENASIDNINTIGTKYKIPAENMMIYVSKGAKLNNFSIEPQQGGTTIEILDTNNQSMGNKNVTLEGGNIGTWYSCKSNTDLKVLNVSGKLSIDNTKDSSGFILLVYGNSPVSLGDADIIIDYHRNIDPPLNTDQFNMTNTVKVRSYQNTYTTVDLNGKNHFNSTIQTRISNYSHESNPNILIMTEKSYDRRITSIYNKDLKSVKKAIFTLEGNISINDTSGMREIVPNKQYEIDFISGTNFDRHINISNINKGDKGTLKVNLLY